MRDQGTSKVNEHGVSTVRDAPGVIIFPPFLYFGMLLFGLLLQFLWPHHIVSGATMAFGARIAGAIVCLSGGMLAMWGRKTMMRAGTNVLPTRPALAIVTDGPFRFTRNPLYLGNVLFYLGFAMIFNSAWLLALFFPLLLVLQWGIIQREERYLEAKFGDAYVAYKARVRRWF
jgi:protein-S-isoprenylcysteine O-methyltransferase Ste14